MKHYPHHIGDFDKATRHLNRIERSVYRDMLDLYYDTEQQLPVDTVWICRKIIARTNEESTAVEQVLNEFFTKTPTGWYHERCEEEIEAYRANTGQKAQAGKASAAAKALKKLQAINGKATPVQQPLNSVVTDGNGTSTNHQPSTNQPINEPNGSVARADQTPSPQSVIDLFHEVLPELPKVRILDDKRKRSISNFCKWVLTSKRTDGVRRAQTTNEAVDWIRSYFDRARDNDFLMGRGTKAPGHERWECDIDFLLSDKGKKFVIEKTREAA